MDAHTPPAESLMRGRQMASGVDWVGVIWFLIVAYGFAWAVWIGLWVVGVSFLIRTLIGMFAPALACLVVRLVCHEGFGDAGLRLAERGVHGVWRMYVAAYVLPIILFAVGGGIALLFGIQQWYLPAYLYSVGLNQFFLGLISTFTLGVLVTMIATFGEEFGWRGYLLPRLAPLGEIWAAILVGLVWGLWHAPIIILDKYEYGTGSWLGVPMFMLVTTGFSIVFAWLRFRSGCIWPTVLAHAVINTAGPVMLVVFVTPGNLYLGAPIGMIGIVSFAVVAIGLIATGRLRMQEASRRAA